MAESNTVKIIEVCKVVPLPLPTNSSYSIPPNYLPLTFFDILFLRLPPVNRLHYFEFPDPNTSFFESILPKLKRSLSLTLRHFLPLTGKIIWPENSHKPIISYHEGNSVSLIVAQSDADFQHLSGTDLCEATECLSLIPNLAVTDEQAQVLALQVTLFPNSGFCIGMTNHHAAIDGKSLTLFRKTWARICRLGTEDSSPVNPFYDRTVIKDPLGLDSIYLNEWLNENGPNNRSLKFWQIEMPPGLIRGIFELTRANIVKLRKKHERNGVHVTTFSLTCAYVLVCLAKAMDIKVEETICVLNVDCRSRLKPCVPETYIGNCVGASAAFAETTGLLGEKGIEVALDAITKAIKSLDDGVLKGAETWASRLSTVKNNSESTVVGLPRSVWTSRSTAIAGSPRFEAYGDDFGWGRPRKVEMTSIDKTGAICFSDSSHGDGGIEVGLVLKRSEMEAFASFFAKGLEAP